MQFQEIPQIFTMTWNTRTQSAFGMLSKCRLCLCKEKRGIKDTAKLGDRPVLQALGKPLLAWSCGDRAFSSVQLFQDSFIFSGLQRDILTCFLSN